MDLLKDFSINSLQQPPSTKTLNPSCTGTIIHQPPSAYISEELLSAKSIEEQALSVNISK